MTSTPIQPYGAAPATPRMEDMAPGGQDDYVYNLSLIHISEPTRLLSISYAVFFKSVSYTHLTLPTKA